MNEVKNAALLLVSAGYSRRSRRTASHGRDARATKCTRRDYERLRRQLAQIWQRSGFSDQNCCKLDHCGESLADEGVARVRALTTVAAGLRPQVQRLRGVRRQKLEKST